MNICVFLSAADLDARYTRPAREFAELIGKGGHTLVWGGSNTGLMKVVADGVREAGGRSSGSRWCFCGTGQDGRRRDADRQGSRRTEGADAHSIGRGDSDGRRPGNADEATEILEQKKHGLHDKPVVLLNTAGFYDGLTLQLRRMEEEGFCRCRWPSWSSSPTTAPVHSPTSRSPSESGDMPP